MADAADREAVRAMLQAVAGEVLSLDDRAGFVRLLEPLEECDRVPRRIRMR